MFIHDVPIITEQYYLECIIAEKFLLAVMFPRTG
jgi:hypothetical protein